MRIIILGLIVILIPVAGAEELQLGFSCINCHPDRYQEWEHSMHALAISDPIFEAEYMRALSTNPEYRSYCLTCHSPTTIITKDFNLTKSISIEGISCIFCHTATGVEGNKYIFSPGNPMQGPYADSKTGAHASAYSSLHTKSEFCAGCHEFSINGVPVYETYSEWKAGPYAAEGKQCQDCHMETKAGAAAKDGPLRDKVYQHFWYGGHTGQFLEKAILIGSSVEQKGNRAKVTLNITNSRVGHKVPSGFPSRKVVLNFKASDGNGNVIFSGQRVYTKTLVDQYGNEVDDFWKAASVANDTRLGPGESRIEVFEFEVPEGVSELNTEASITYQLEASILQQVSINADVAETKGTTFLTTPPAGTVPTTPNGSPGIGWSGSFVIMIAAILYLRRKRSKNE